MHLNKAKIDDLGAFRLVAFNSGFLPGGDKKIITKPEITLLAQEAAKGIQYQEDLSAWWFLWGIPVAGDTSTLVNSYGNLVVEYALKDIFDFAIQGKIRDYAHFCFEISS
uniref:Uncharacterized protein n=1 Tax=Quercus lobata TaxID=97700 RepID=A0A7N2LK36_QUELO